MKNGRYQLKDVPRVDMLRAIAERAMERFSGPPWWERHGLDRYPPKLLLIAAERLDDLVEYGVSIRCSWLTEKGEAALAKGV